MRNIHIFCKCFHLPHSSAILYLSLYFSVFVFFFYCLYWPLHVYCPLSFAVHTLKGARASHIYWCLNFLLANHLLGIDRQLLAVCCCCYCTCSNCWFWWFCWLLQLLLQFVHIWLANKAPGKSKVKITLHLVMANDLFGCRHCHFGIAKLQETCVCVCVPRVLLELLFFQTKCYTLKLHLIWGLIPAQFSFRW